MYLYRYGVLKIYVCWNYTTTTKGQTQYRKRRRKKNTGIAPPIPNLKHLLNPKATQKRFVSKAKFKKFRMHLHRSCWTSQSTPFQNSQSLQLVIKFSQNNPHFLPSLHIHPSLAIVSLLLATVEDLRMIVSSESPRKARKRTCLPNRSPASSYIYIYITSTILVSFHSVLPPSGTAKRLPAVLAFGVVNYANSKYHNHRYRSQKPKRSLIATGHRNLYLDDENSFDRSHMNINLDNFDVDEDEDLDEYCLVFDDFGCEAFENVTKAPTNSNGEEEGEDSASCKIKRSMLNQENRNEESKLANTQNDDQIDNKNHTEGKVGESTILQWIRLQARPDEVLNDIQTKDQILEKIDHVKDTQSNHGKADLYKRYWEPSSAALKEESRREDKAETMKKRNTFSVLQFNALAEGLSSGPETKTPFATDPQKANGNNFGGFTQINFPELVLNFAQRRWRLVEVILGNPKQQDGSNSGSKDDNCDGDDDLFDLIAMEEVDRYRGFFKPVLRLFGYHGIFIPKPKAPGIRLGWYSDGCALFFNKRTFELVSSNPGEYKVGTQVFIICTLLHRASGKSIVVAVTHLKAQRSETNEIIRKAQISELLEYVEEMADLASTTTTADGNDGDEISVQPPILIMGDLNADPPCITGPGGCVERVLQTGRYRSAYPVQDLSSSSNLFSTWKTRGDSTVQRMIDYIFYSSDGGLTCTDTLSIPEEEAIATDGYLPSLRYPSDHLSIGAKFDFGDNTD